MSFVRPEARAALWRWREVMVGAAVLVIAVMWIAVSFGFLRWMAYALTLVAVLTIAAGIQRARFRGRGGGSGVVEVDERKVTYYGPLDGGAVALSDLAALSLDRRAKPAHWQLVPEGGGTLQIPVDAEGSDALFDAFSSVPGLRAAKLIAALESPEDRHIVIWRRADVQKRVMQLH